MKNNLIFKLNDEQYIKFLLPRSKLEICACEEIEVDLYNKEKKYLLYKNECGIDSFYSFNYILKRVVDNQYELHESIVEDIGYLWNEYLSDRKSHNFFVENSTSSTGWIGKKYLLWSSKGSEAWMYNKNGSIILEITPVYKWHFTEPKKSEKYIPYEEFIKDYKPLFIIEINKKTAEKWLKETERILQIVDKNEKKYSKEDAKRDR